MWETTEKFGKFKLQLKGERESETRIANAEDSVGHNSCCRAVWVRVVCGLWQDGEEYWTLQSTGF